MYKVWILSIMDLDIIDWAVETQEGGIIELHAVVMGTGDKKLGPPKTVLTP